MMEKILNVWRYCSSNLTLFHAQIRLLSLINAKNTARESGPKSPFVSRTVLKMRRKFQFLSQ